MSNSSQLSPHVSPRPSRRSSAFAFSFSQTDANNAMSTPMIMKMSETENSVQSARPLSPYTKSILQKGEIGSPKSARSTSRNLLTCSPDAKIVLTILLIFSVIGSPFLTWHLTIGKGPPSPSQQDQPVFFPCQRDNNDNSTCCANGVLGLCDLALNEVLFATVHNAMSTREDYFWKPNNRWGIQGALDAGYRSFMLDTCICHPTYQLSFCHSICNAGNIGAQEILSPLSRFMKKNPTEIVILHFQLNSHYPGILFMLHDEIVAAGLGSLIHVHQGYGKPWATMRELQENNERLVIFHMNGPNCWPLSLCPPGYHNLHWYTIETTYSMIGVDSLLDYNSSCSIVRGNSNHPNFFLMNHFANGLIGLPEIRIARVVNKRAVLLDRIDACANEIGMRPSFVAVDFWNKGDLVAVTQEYNKDSIITRGGDKI